MAAGGVEIGEVETPIFSGPLREPDYLLVRTVRAIAGTFRVVPAARVARVDPERRTLSLAVDGAAVASLPERLPLRHEAVA